MADRAGLSRWVVSRIEHGRLDGLTIGAVRAVVRVLDARLDLQVRWQGGDLPRLLSARHGALHEAVARWFATLPEWTAEPEVSFSIRGERGIIDILAWHPTRRVLLVIELKTEIVDVNEMLGTLDRKRRLAWSIARERGWDPLGISVWVVLADSRTNRRHVAGHAAVLRAKLPTDGRTMRAWLRAPSDPVYALSFLPSAGDAHLGRATTATKRVARVRPRTTPRP